MKTLSDMRKDRLAEIASLEADLVGVMRHALFDKGLERGGS